MHVAAEICWEVDTASGTCPSLLGESHSSGAGGGSISVPFCSLLIDSGERVDWELGEWRAVAGLETRLTVHHGNTIWRHFRTAYQSSTQHPTWAVAQSLHLWAMCLLPVLLAVHLLAPPALAGSASWGPLLNFLQWKSLFLAHQNHFLSNC